ncbi:ABC-2 transporter permease [Lentibacillus sediminis]|uniref:ABC-2 transporter permease n=1 Tax=Lentibacillus sediminis TaxID=1940529 RepID=UPI000C1BE815|nr:ABC-2 transporter permease [Lentibacillus sediminis]
MVIQLLRNEMFSQKAYNYVLAFSSFIPFTGFFTSGVPIRHILLIIVLSSWVPLIAPYYERDALLNSLPVTRKKIVTAKYLAPLMWSIPATVIVFIYVFLFVTYAPFPARLITGWDLLLALAGLYLLISFFYPLLISLGYIAATTLTAITGGAIMIGVQMVINIYHNPSMTSLDSTVENIIANPNAFILLFAGITLIITLLSYALSVKLYERKDF